jgi:hypothetical protein
MIESLESRRLLSATVPLVQLHAVSPNKILAGGKTAYEVVTVHNLTAEPVTEDVAITLEPSLDGTTVAGTLGGGTLSETVTLKKHGAVNLKVGFVPPITQQAGKYYTLVTTTVADTTTTTATAPGTYTLTLPPEPTTTPSLVGDYSGIVESYKSTTNGVGLFGHTTSTRIEILTFKWTTTSQTDQSLTGTFAVGAQQSTGTMVGTELTNGAIDYTLTSDLIDYTIVGKITTVKGVQTLSGTFKGTLVGNLFSSLNGKFKIAATT